MKGLLKRRDLGPAFREHSPAPSPSAPAANDCAAAPGGPLNKLANGVTHAGPTFKYRKSDAFVYSFTDVFVSKRDAVEYLKIHGSAGYRKCRAAQFEKDVQAAQDQGGKWTVRAQPLGKADDEFAGVAYHLLFKGDRTQSTYARYAFRNDRLVLTVAWDYNNPPRGAEWINDRLARAIDRAVAAAYRRIGKKGSPTEAAQQRRPTSEPGSG